MMVTKDSRTDNRHREHDEHGLVETKRFPGDGDGKTFWECPCNWVGWLFY